MRAADSTSAARGAGTSGRDAAGLPLAETRPLVRAEGNGTEEEEGRSDSAETTSIRAGGSTGNGDGAHAKSAARSAAWKRSDAARALLMRGRRRDMERL